MEGGTMESYMNRISNTGIVPVVKILEKEDAYPLAKALLNGGIDVIEVTYRSEHATSAIQTISEQLPDMLVGAGTVLSVEQAKEAVEAGADIIMLDNMSVENMKKAIEIIDGRAETECSGNVTKENIEKLTALGVDYISSGALTHSAPILDLSLKNLQVK